MIEEEYVYASHRERTVSAVAEGNALRCAQRGRGEDGFQGSQSSPDSLGLHRPLGAPEWNPLLPLWTPLNPLKTTRAVALDPGLFTKLHIQPRDPRVSTLGRLQGGRSPEVLGGRIETPPCTFGRGWGMESPCRLFPRQRSPSPLYGMQFHLHKKQAVPSGNGLSSFICQN